jgi:site-specific recombinase XerD
MTPPLVTLPVLVQDFFEKHLTVERQASRNTVLAYRDALKLFLEHAATLRKCCAEQLDHTVLDADVVRSFLDALSKQRECGPRTRNQRLAAVKAFARFVASIAPEHLERCRRIRELLPARFERPEVRYLDDTEVVALIRSVPADHRRYRALLLLLYNTGARVQEVVDLNVGDLRLDPVPVVTLRGKGRKHRTCPLWNRTVEALRAWLDERPNCSPAAPLFLNARGTRISRSGIAHVISCQVKKAGIRTRHTQNVSPHVLRHTTAMHLLKQGVDITTIAAWLGHADLSTTHAYVEIDLRMKQAAVAASAALPALQGGSFPAKGLLAWLTNLGRSNYAQHPPAPAPEFPSSRRQLHITRSSP